VLEILPKTLYATLADNSFEVDLVNIFRAFEYMSALVD